MRQEKGDLGGGNIRRCFFYIKTNRSDSQMESVLVFRALARKGVPASIVEEGRFGND